MKTRIHLQLCKINENSSYALLNDFFYDIQPFSYFNVWDGKHYYPFLKYHPERNLLLMDPFRYDLRTLNNFDYLKEKYEEMTDED